MVKHSEKHEGGKMSKVRVAKTDVELAEEHFKESRKVRIKELKSARNSINKELRKLGVKTKKSKKKGK
jgi:hypothetical protein